MDTGRAERRKGVMNEDRNTSAFRVQSVTSHNSKLSTDIFYIKKYIYNIYTSLVEQSLVSETVLTMKKGVFSVTEKHHKLTI